MENEPCGPEHGCWYFRNGFTACPGEGCVLQGRAFKYGAMVYEPGDASDPGQYMPIDGAAAFSTAQERAQRLSNPHELRAQRRLHDQMQEDIARLGEERPPADPSAFRGRHWECPACHTRVVAPAEHDGVLCGCQLGGVQMREVSEPPFPGNPGHDTRDDAIHAAAAQAGVPQPPAHFTDIRVEVHADDSQFQQAIGISLAHCATLTGMPVDIPGTEADGSFSGGLWQEIPTEPFRMEYIRAVSPEDAARYAAEVHGHELSVHTWRAMSAHPERLRPEYCWRSWPPRHTPECGCEVTLAQQISVIVPPDDCGGGS